MYLATVPAYVLEEGRDPSLQIRTEVLNNELEAVFR